MFGSFAKGGHALTDVVEASSFWIDRDNLCLWRSHASGEDERVRLTPKSFDVLCYLAENAGRSEPVHRLLVRGSSDCGFRIC